MLKNFWNNWMHPVEQWRQPRPRRLSSWAPCRAAGLGGGGILEVIEVEAAGMKVAVEGVIGTTRMSSILPLRL